MHCWITIQSPFVVSRESIAYVTMSSISDSELARHVRCII